MGEPARDSHLEMNSGNWVAGSEERPGWYDRLPFMQKRHYCLIDFHLSLSTELMYAKQARLSSEPKNAAREPFISVRSLRAKMIF